MHESSITVAPRYHRQLHPFIQTLLLNSYHNHENRRRWLWRRWTGFHLGTSLVAKRHGSDSCVLQALNEYSDHQVDLYDSDSRPGGHANTLPFTNPKNGQTTMVDTYVLPHHLDSSNRLLVDLYVWIVYHDPTHTAPDRLQPTHLSQLSPFLKPSRRQDCRHRNDLCTQSGQWGIRMGRRHTLHPFLSTWQPLQGFHVENDMGYPPVQC